MSVSTWIKKSLSDERRREAIASLELALEQLKECEETTSAADWADNLSAADAHIFQAKTAINDAFNGIGDE